MTSKFIFSVALSLFVNSFTYAKSENPWEIIYEASEKATSSSGFEFLQKKYPNIFGNYNPQKVTSANIATKIYEFKGTHSCAEGDPRLKYESLEYGLCEKGSNGYLGKCFQTAVAIPSPFDPCAK